MLIVAECFNAWCLRGNKIIISTGYLVFCRKEGQVAAILGHEMAHHISPHLAEDHSYEKQTDCPSSQLLDIDNLTNKDIRSCKHEYGAEHNILILISGGWVPPPGLYRFHGADCAGRGSVYGRMDTRHNSPICK